MRGRSLYGGQAMELVPPNHTMKKIFLILSASVLAVTLVSAQTNPTLNSSLPASSVNPGLPGFNNSFGPLFTNQFGNAFASTALNQLLIQVQFDLTQIYPVVVSINNSFDFTVAGTNANTAFGTRGIGSPAAQGSLPTTSTGATANLGTSLGQDLSGIIGGGANALGTGSTVLNGGVSTAITPLTPTTGAGTTGSAAVSGGLAFTSTRDVLRALLLLQDDIERMLPLVNALNGGNMTTLNSVFTNNVGLITNTSTINAGGSTTSTSTPGSTTLTPTGR